jgi:hypothetical protein
MNNKWQLLVSQIFLIVNTMCAAWMVVCFVENHAPGFVVCFVLNVLAVYIHITNIKTFGKK